MPSLSVRPFGLFVAAFFVVLLTAPAGLSEAFGACGDYVHLGQVEPDLGIDAAHADPHADPSAGLPGWPRTRRPAPVPCDGPACNQKPHLPIAPAPLPPSTSADQTAWLEAEVATSPAEPGRIVADADLTPDDVRAGRMERPPRRGS